MTDSLPMRVLAVVLGCLALAAPLCAEAPQWHNDPAQSQLRFSASAQGEAFDGSFARFTAQIRFDPEALESSRFEVAIALDSVDSRNEERDAMLAEPEFFDLARHPQAHYVAERFERLADGRFRADGQLTLRGVERPVPLLFEWRADGMQAILIGEAQLDRLQFQVGAGEWSDPELIEPQVRVHTRLHLRRAD